MLRLRFEMRDNLLSLSFFSTFIDLSYCSSILEFLLFGICKGCTLRELSLSTVVP